MPFLGPAVTDRDTGRIPPSRFTNVLHPPLSARQFARGEAKGRGDELSLLRCICDFPSPAVAFGAFDVRRVKSSVPPTVTNKGKNTDGRDGREEARGGGAAHVAIKAEALILENAAPRSFPTLTRNFCPATSSHATFTPSARSRPVLLRSLSQELHRVSDACGFSARAEEPGNVNPPRTPTYDR